MTREELGQRLRELRQRRGWTQKYTAQKSGLAAATIQRLECGQFSPTLELFFKVAGAFGLPAGALLLDEDFDEILEVSAYVRQLPELEQSVATAVLRTLWDHASGEI
jgi:transcriptional regulator with XRE-family HTH domain